MTDMLGLYHLGPNDTPENGIYTGDARELAQAIPDESVDLIFTDPVYDRIGDYRWLAETATRILKPNKACLTWCGIGYKDLVMEALTIGGLRYRWENILYLMGRVVPQHGDMGFCNYASLLWFENGRMPCRRSRDLIGVMPYQEKMPVGKSVWDWSKPADPIAEWASAFTKDTDVILDPFTGGGTVPAVCKMLGRKYLAFEIDPIVAERARERVRNTNPPLFVLEPEQTSFLDDK